jgi:4-amino-4-deoxy-L-arabinose transferase-like glycosyltransferase
LQPSTLAKRVSVFLLIAIIAFYFYGLGHLPLVGPDEPRYAQVAREMLLRHDLITPTLGGRNWFEKPALLYWMMMIAFKMFGVSEWSARLPSAVSGLLTIAAVWCVGRQVERKTSTSELSDLGFWSALAAATSLGLIVFSRGATFDIIITMTTTWALSFFVLQEFATTSRARTTLLSGFYIAVGLSLLAKGLVGVVIPFGVVGLYYVLRREWPARRVRSTLIWGVPIALAVSATWYGPMIYRNGWPFIHEFFIEHHLARYFSNKYHHPQPVYFYPVIMVALTLPWTAFLLAGIADVRTAQWRDSDALSKMRVFSLAWLLLPILFFSFSGSKLPGYILPIVPAASLLAGERLSSLRNASGGRDWPLRATGLISVLLGATVLVYTAFSANLPARCAVWIASPLFVAGIFAVGWTRFQRTASILVAGATLAALVSVLNCGVNDLAQRESARNLLSLADARGYSQAAVFARPGDDRTAEFYASGRVVYGPDGDVASLDNIPQMVVEVRRRSVPILVFVPIDSQFSGSAGSIVETFGNGSSAVIETIGNNGKVVLVGVKLR